MPSEQRAVHPDDVPHIGVLRDDLDDAFRATKRRYLDRGADEKEARELAEAYVRQRLKDATLDLGPDVEAVTVREIVAYIGRWKWTVWLTAFAALAGWSYALVRFSELDSHHVAILVMDGGTGRGPGLLGSGRNLCRRTVATAHD